MFSRFAKVGTALAVVGSSAAMFANETTGANIPDVGVDVASFITAGIGVIGGVVAVAIGGYVAFLVVKKALKWIGRALS